MLRKEPGMCKTCIMYTHVHRVLRDRGTQGIVNNIIKQR